MRVALRLLSLCAVASLAGAQQGILLSGANAVVSGQSLLSLLNAQPAAGTQLSGVTGYLFGTSQFTQSWNATTLTANAGAPNPFTSSNWGTLNVFSSSGSTGQQATIINLFAAPNAAYGTDTTIAQACTPYPSISCSSSFLSPPFDWLTQAEAAGANHQIAFIQFQYRDPAGAGNNPWGTSVCGGPTIDLLKPGCSVNTKWNSDIDLGATQLLLLTYPFMVTWAVEANESNCPIPSGGVPYAWYAFQNNSSAACSSSTNLQAAWQYWVARMKADGVIHGLFVFENNAFGGAAWTYGYPGSSFVDVVALDQASVPPVKDSTSYSSMQATGKPMIFGSMVACNNGNCSGIGTNSINVGSYIATYATDYPAFAAWVWWGGNSNSSEWIKQSNVSGALGSPNIPLSGLPALGSAGGLGGG
jgi:hypothetical protein